MEKLGILNCYCHLYIRNLVTKVELHFCIRYIINYVNDRIKFYNIHMTKTKMLSFLPLLLSNVIIKFK